MDRISIALDLVALLLAGEVFLRRDAATWKRCVAAFTSLACAVTSPVLIAAGSGPQWTRVGAVCAMFLSFCAVAAVVSPIGGSSEDDGTGGVTDGDWDPHLPDAPRGGTDDFEPDWWPEFERDFADYVTRPVTAGDPSRLSA